MKKVIAKILILFGALAVISCNSVSDDAIKGKKPTEVSTTNQAAPIKPKQPVPAYQGEEGIKTLKPTLSPDMFQGQIKAAYAAVKEIPKTIAQLLCYCHCDRSMGHKSLHSCFEDDHAAGCGICMNSALKAYKLEKEKKMTPDQIRAELIKEYGDPT